MSQNVPLPLPGVGEPQIVAEFTIRLNSAGQINVSGPIDQTMMCMGLLEMAKNVVFEHNKQAQQQRIVQPVTGILPRV